CEDGAVRPPPAPGGRLGASSGRGRGSRRTADPHRAPSLRGDRPAVRFVLPFLLFALPFAAVASPAEELRRAKDLFEYGEYEEALRLAAGLLSQNVLASDEDLIDANRIVALSYLYGDRPDRHEKAQQYFL